MNICSNALNSRYSLSRVLPRQDTRSEEQYNKCGDKSREYAREDCRGEGLVRVEIGRRVIVA